MLLQASPDFKGIKTTARTRCALYLVSFKPALISKGLRRSHRDGHFQHPLQASPDFKGIKTHCLSRRIERYGFKPALISKGLRPHSILVPKSRSMLQASPDFKGIKTHESLRQARRIWLQASPDFKGIKTRRAPKRHTAKRFKPALISKGLRPLYGVDARVGGLQASPDFKGIKTAGVACFPNSITLQASPDFKGIKTRQECLCGQSFLASSQP